MKRKSASRKRKPGRVPTGAGKLRPIGIIRSPLKNRHGAPRQGNEGAPDCWLEIAPPLRKATHGLHAGMDVILLTWLHEAVRDVLKVRPRSDPKRRLTGVFATRSPDRPNPIGLHRVTIYSMRGLRLKIGPLEAIDGTPVLDIKPVLPQLRDA